MEEKRDVRNMRNNTPGTLRRRVNWGIEKTKGGDWRQMRIK